ncbi:MAG: ABC transporter permease subunit [Polyangiaceae bacterium]
MASNTYRECVRARILLGLGALALGTALYSIAIGAFTLTNAPRVVADLGAASISLYAIIVAVVIGGTTVHRELELKTIFPILARPIRREEYVVGKYLGILLTLIVFISLDAASVLLIVATMAGRSPVLTVGVGVAVAAIVAAAPFVWPRSATKITAVVGLISMAVAFFLASPSPDEQRVVAGMALLSVCEVAIVAGIATLFSSFSTPFLSAVLTTGVFLIGRSADTLAKLPAKTFGPQIKAMGEVLSHVVPNLQVYVPPRPLLTGESDAVSLAPYLGLSAAQSLAWAVGLLTVSCLVFRRRDFL